jgi:hypothetical protein
MEVQCCPGTGCGQRPAGRHAGPGAHAPAVHPHRARRPPADGPWRHVHPDLVRTSRCKLQRTSILSRHWPAARRSSRQSLPGDRCKSTTRHAQAVAPGRARSGHRHGALVRPSSAGGPDARYWRDTVALRDHPDQRVHGLARPGHQHQAAGVLVEPVHDARTRQQGAWLSAGQQAIEQGAAPVAGRRDARPAQPACPAPAGDRPRGPRRSAIASGLKAWLCGVGRNSTWPWSPALTFRAGRKAAAPLRLTAPASISCCR